MSHGFKVFSSAEVDKEPRSDLNKTIPFLRNIQTTLRAQATNGRESLLHIESRRPILSPCSLTEDVNCLLDCVD